MSIVTKQGDKGKTRLYSGEEVSKASKRVSAYGTVDELVSAMGLARSFCGDKSVSDIILENQEILFRLGTELATKKAGKIKLIPIAKSDVAKIEETIKKLENSITLPKKFIIPGDNTESAVLDFARTVCRRLERELVALSDSGEWKNEEALIFINRLSDLLFLLSAKVSKR